MKKITDHKLNSLNECLDVIATDEPGAGGAYHRYQITGYDTAKNPSSSSGDGATIILFQNGGLQEVGCANGISQEALLAILIDRLRSFQAGPFSCRENALALTKMEEALMWLQKRTQDRLRRGVEGVSVK
jgi:hypothetical protein